MGRPRKFRQIMFNPKSNYFKPRGIPMHMLQEIVLEKDEMETVRLCDLEQMDMLQVAEKMKVSKSTIHRLLAKAHKKIAEALVKGKALRIED